ncbi:MAG: ATP-binding cassette domain-containing protein [Actinobacteria bacterium]|nr:ATP-binding cassette domain-containing protein [Actinomycetota bacterium]
MTEPLLVVEDLVKDFPVRRGAVFGRQVGTVRAVDGVSFDVRPGETLGIVGESGCGKSTLARCVMRLLDVESGRIEFAGRDITHLSRREMRDVRSDLMMVFQDPYESLNPHMRVGDIIAEPLEIYKRRPEGGIRHRVKELLDRVGLRPEHYDRFPHEFSGGQRQRIGIARALALEPKLIVCDEPVTALDVSVQAQILNLLSDLQGEFGLTYIFIAHDLDVVRHVSDRLCVMYLGQISERGRCEDVYRHPRHPYSASLMAAVPIADPKLARARKPIVLEGEIPSPLDRPGACRFHPRCPRATEICAAEDPPARQFEPDHEAHCYFPVERWPLDDPSELASRTDPDAAVQSS